jgi:hypothetical protein
MGVILHHFVSTLAALESQALWPQVTDLCEWRSTCRVGLRPSGADVSGESRPLG